MYTVRSFAINAAEARYILAAYTSAGIYAPDLDHRVQKLTHVLGKEGYFLESGRWNAKKWRETDFIILKDAGPVNDRITEFEEDEQRMATATWWLVNLCMQLEALDLEFNRPLEAQTDFGYSASPIEPPTVVSISTPEMVQRAVESALEKKQLAKANKKTRSGSDHNLPPAVLFPVQRTHTLCLRPEEPKKLSKFLKSLPSGVTYNDTKERLGEELTTVLLEYHVLVLVHGDLPGLVRVNIHMLEALDFSVQADGPRLRENTEVGALKVQEVRQRLVKVANIYQNEQFHLKAKTKKAVASLKKESPKVVALPAAGVNLPAESTEQAVVPTKPITEKRLALPLTSEEVTAFRDLLNKWEAGVKAEEGEQALGASLYQALHQNGYLEVDEVTSLLTLNEAQFAETLLTPTKAPALNRFCMMAGLLPAKTISLKDRLRRISRTVRQTTNVATDSSGLWQLYLKVEETEKLLTAIIEGTTVSAREMISILGEEILTGLCVAGLFTKSVDDDSLLPIWDEFNKLIIHDWVSNGRPKTRLGRVIQNSLPVQDFTTRLQNLREKQKKMIVAE